MTKGKFYYFGFGSNLLERRIKIQNPSAQRYAVGKLKGYRLDFADSSVDKIYYSQTWNGVPATIIEDANSLVYGAVWTIDNDQIEELDKQEGVECGIYKPLILKVLIDNDEKEVSCRSYQLVHNPRMLQEPHERPFERQPSKTYLMVIINGAIESRLPDYYINFLRSFKHNGNHAFDQDLVTKLNLKELL